MKRLALCAAACALSACAGEPPAPLALAPPVTEPAPATPAQPAAADAIVTAPAAPAAPPTEPAPPARPPQTEKGQWAVVVVSERKVADTRHWVKRLADAGFRAEVERADVGGTTWYRVLLPGYRADGEARAVLPFANQAAGVNDAFIWRRGKKAPATAKEAPPAAPTKKAAAEEQPAN